MYARLGTSMTIGARPLRSSFLSHGMTPPVLSGTCGEAQMAARGECICKAGYIDDDGGPGPCFLASSFEDLHLQCPQVHSARQESRREKSVFARLGTLVMMGVLALRHVRTPTRSRQEPTRTPNSRALREDIMRPCFTHTAFPHPGAHLPECARASAIYAVLSVRVGLRLWVRVPLLEEVLKCWGVFASQDSIGQRGLFCLHEILDAADVGKIFLCWYLFQ